MNSARPERINYDSLFESSRILRNLPLQLGDTPHGIVQRNAGFRFGQVNDAIKAGDWLLVVIVANNPLVRFVNGLSDLTEVTVKKVQLACACLNPSATIDPRSPPIKICHNRIDVAARNLRGDPTNLANRKGRLRLIVDSDIEIGLLVLSPARVGTA